MHSLSPRHFADADAPYDAARYVLFGVPYDGTTSYRSGTRGGPAAIREASLNFESYLVDYDLDLADVPVCDAGDIEPFSLPDAVVAQVEDVVRDICRGGKVPVMIGGEHSITPGAVRAVAPEWYVVCDAHLDLRPEFGGTRDNHACACRRVYDAGVRNIVIIGARSGTREEYAFAQDLHLYTADEVRKRGMSTVVREVAGIVGNARTYLSIDADAVDCCATPGLGTPEPFGLSPSDLRDLVRALAPTVVGFDYVEVCPCDAGQTAAVAARIIRDFIGCHFRHGREESLL
ncbi:MAG: agmatinase [Methanomicrobiaceae archaeon]|nr:agmatinase [Methanomicrobiaceae archaeon]